MHPGVVALLLIGGLSAAAPGTAAPGMAAQVPAGTAAQGRSGTVAPGSALVSRRSISAEAAQAIARVALQAGRERRCELAVAVLDQAGTLLVLLRSDGASQQFVEGAAQKAWTALNLRASTRDLLRTIQQGQQDDAQLPFIPKSLFLMGGVPLRDGDSVVGAVGAAGCVAGVDDDGVAQRAAQAFARMLNP